MKDRNTDYNLLDLIESSSKARKQSQQEHAADVAPSQGPAPEASVAETQAQTPENAVRNTRPIKPVAPQAASDAEKQPPEEKLPFFKRVGRFFATLPSRTGTFFRELPGRTRAFFKGLPGRTKVFFKELPGRTKAAWERFKPRFAREWKLFWKRIRWKKVINRTFICLIYPLTLFIMAKVSGYTNQVESLYSDGLGYVIRMVLNVFSSIFAMAVSDVLTWILVAIILVALGYTIYRIAAERHGYRKWYAAIGFSSGMCVFLAVMFFIYQLFFGINVYRKPLDQVMNLPTRQATADELTSACENLVYRASEVREYLGETQDGTVKLPDRNAYLNNAADGINRGIRYFGNLSFQQELAVGDMKLKMSVAKFTGFSWLLNRLDRDGCYQPFTGEVLINNSVSDYQMPATVCFYLGEQMGFADSEACSFLAFLSAVNHADPYYNYSGLMLGLSECMDQLHDMDYASWLNIRSTFSDAMNRDIAASGQFNWFEVQEGGGEAGHIGANQTGTKYGMAVDLILSYYREGYMKDIPVGVRPPEETTGGVEVTTDTEDVTTDTVDVTTGAAD